jgi:DNA-binding response OmpR family regulator
MSSHLLIVDDDPSCLASMHRVLRRQVGSVLLPAIGGEEATRLPETCAPDRILMDIMMPGANGHELCRRVRADPRRRFVKILAVSGRTTTADRLTAYAAGADDFLAKPFNQDGLPARPRSAGIASTTRPGSGSSGSAP